MHVKVNCNQEKGSSAVISRNRQHIVEKDKKTHCEENANGQQTIRLILTRQRLG
jgi:hypothetical protein